MLRTRRLVASSAALAAAACLLATGPAAEAAAQPLAHHVYRGDGGQPGTDVTVKFTLKVGTKTNRFTKAVVEVSCPTAHNKITFKNVPIKDGYLTKTITYPNSSLARFQLTGQVKSRHKLTLSFQTQDSSEPCGNYVMDGMAKG